VVEAKTDINLWRMGLPARGPCRLGAPAERLTKRQAKRHVIAECTSGSLVYPGGACFCFTLSRSQLAYGIRQGLQFFLGIEEVRARPNIGVRLRDEANHELLGEELLGRLLGRYL
jgi:hypothetical protein